MGAVSGSGGATIDGAATLEFGAASSANTVFGTGDGVLRLDMQLRHVLGELNP